MVAIAQSQPATQALAPTVYLPSRRPEAPVKETKQTVVVRKV